MQSDEDRKWFTEPLHPLDEEIEEETSESIYNYQA
jgi:hypothetical protein